jgi:uncharacterized protein YcbX
MTDRLARACGLAEETLVGRVVALWRYPVKSMAAEAIPAADVSWHGLPGDRRWAFVRPGLESSSFPWLTIRERSDLWRFEPVFADPARPDASATQVRAPSGETFDVTSPALAELLAPGVRVIRQNRGVFDAAPLSLMTSQTVAALGSSAGRPSLEPLRFRPNLLVDATSGGPFEEDGWIGATLRVGGLVMRIDRRDERCVIVNVDPRTAVRDPAVLRTIARERQACLGVYGTTVEPGRVAVGDVVSIEQPPRREPAPRVDGIRSERESDEAPEPGDGGPDLRRVHGPHGRDDHQRRAPHDPG